MLIFDLTVEFTVGAVFALAHRERLVDPDVHVLGDRAFRHGLLYSAFFYVASAMFFLIGWPGWNSMYLLDLESHTIHLAWFAYLDSVALFGCYVLGYLFGVRWLRRGAGHFSPLALRLSSLWLCVGLALFVWLWDRSFTVTSHSHFIARDRARFDVRWGAEDSFFGHPLMYWLILWMVIDFGPLVFIYRQARKAAAVVPTNAGRGASPNARRQT